MYRYTIFLFFVLLLKAGLAQEQKQEFEKPIDREEAPASMQEIVPNFFPEAKRIHYYHESDGQQEFYELKLKFKKRYLSIEYFGNGQFMDVEELFSFDELPADAQETLRSFFETGFQSYHFSRVQMQYRGNKASEVFEAVKTKNRQAVDLFYEIEAEVKGGPENRYGPYEFLFNSKGELISVRPIVKRTSDNVTY